MGILDKLGIKNKEEKKKPAAEPKPQEVSLSPDQKPRHREDKGSAQNAYQILIKPVISEKGTALAGQGRYVFAVSKNANKSEVKKSIQRTYDVDVESVKIVKMPGKFRRYGRSVGRTSSWKKAIITVKKGQKIPGIIEAVG